MPNSKSKQRQSPTRRRPQKLHWLSSLASCFLGLCRSCSRRGLLCALVVLSALFIILATVRNDFYHSIFILKPLAHANTGVSFKRPKYHFTALKNWINDPNGPFYNPTTKTYHLFYQHHPHSTNWGPMHWGHIQSHDLIHWKDQPIALHPGPTLYDKSDVYSGSVVPKGYKGLPTMFYTGIPKQKVKNALSDAFGIYLYGREVQAMAVSVDEGVTWTKVDENPLISGAPVGLDITAFRDPFIFDSHVLDLALMSSGQPPVSQRDGNKTIQYMLIGGGIKHQSGTLFIYQSTDWIHWNPLPTTFFPSYPQSPNHTPHVKQNQQSSIHNHINTSRALENIFEVPNFWVLHEEIKGERNGKRVPCLLICSHGSAWFLGDVLYHRENGSIEFQSVRDDKLDFGNYYAPTGMLDPTKDRVIIWGWIKEDDSNAMYQRKQRGWAGMHSIAREIYIQVHENIDINQQDPLIGQWIHDVDEEGTSRVKTFGQRPILETKKLRLAKEFELGVQQNHSGKVWENMALLKSDGHFKRSFKLHGKSVDLKFLDFKGDAYEVEAIVDFSDVKSITIFGLSVSHSKPQHVKHLDLEEERTLVYYHHKLNQVVVDRNHSSTHTGFGKNAHVAPLGLLKTKDGVLEKLHLRVFVDRGVVEVYANERAVISSRIYPQRDDSVYLGVFVDEGVFDLDTFDVFGMGDVLPDRLIV